MLNTVLIVPKLNPNTPTLMDGEVRLFKRKHSKVWQIAFTLDGRQVRVSSKKRIVNDAVAAALGEGNLGEFGERGLTLLGSLIIAFSHFKNYQVCKSIDCSCHEQ